MREVVEADPDMFQVQAAAAREELEDDPLRPQYHFTAPANWLNDPNGLIQWRGEFHLFYQHNPYSPLSATKHWGHAVSHDLIHWSDLPIALAPTADSYDADGIYSGCTVDDSGTPSILYSGVCGPHQLVCLATGDDQLLRWSKAPGNPVVPDYPTDLDILTTDEGKVHYRDPSVWREGDQWKMIVGSGIRNVGGTILLYSSPDLRTWKYERPLLVGDQDSHAPIWTGTMWECPQFFPLGGQHVLLISVWHERKTLYPAYITGTYDNGQFMPVYSAILDPGSHYAPQTLLDDRGRRILIGWLREQRPPAAAVSAGWSGAMTIPWQLGLGDDGSLRYSPVPELATLRRKHQRLSDLEVNSCDPVAIPGLEGDCLELQATFVPGGANEFGLIVRRSPDGTEQTRVVYEPNENRLSIDRTRSSSDQSIDSTRHHAPLELADGESLQLRVFLDRSVIEVMANERALVSERIYPSQRNSLGIAPFATGGPCQISVLEAWEMASCFAP
jgi:beta-fructofuranosidase